jgi:hypothetical protein
MFRRLHACAALGALLLTGVACTKQALPAPDPVVTPSDHVSPASEAATETVLQKTFDLKDSVIVPFEIPAHAVQPHLHGAFASFAGGAHGVSDASADIDFLILNDDQHSQFAGGHASDSMFSVEASHNQAVNFDLPPSMNRPVKYYLVFRNPQGGKANKVVEASFRVEF